MNNQLSPFQNFINGYANGAMKLPNGINLIALLLGVVLFIPGCIIYFYALFIKESPKIALSILGIMFAFMMIFVVNQPIFTGPILGGIAVFGGWKAYAWFVSRNTPLLGDYTEVVIEDHDELTLEETPKLAALVRVSMDTLAPKSWEKYKAKYPKKMEYEKVVGYQDPNKTAENRAATDLFNEASIDAEDARIWQKRYDDTEACFTEFRTVGDYYDVSVSIPEGIAEEDWLALHKKVKPALGLFSFDPIDHDNAAGIVNVHLYHRNPNKVQLRCEGGFAYPVDYPVTWTNIPFGMTASGKVGTLGLEESNIVFGGAPGGGKSIGTRTYLRGAAQLDGLAMIGIDLKKVELAPWDPRLSARAKTIDDALELLRLLKDEMGRRYLWLEENNLDKITPEIAAQYGINIILILIDEYAKLSAFTSDDSPKWEKDTQSELKLLTRQIVAEGRAAGMPMIIATQKPSAKILDTDFRDMFQQGIVYKTRTKAMTDMIIGSGGAAAGADAHDFETDRASKGLCFVVSEGSNLPIKMRTFFTPGGEELAEIVASVAHKRVNLAFLDDYNERLSNRTSTPTPAVAIAPPAKPTGIYSRNYDEASAAPVAPKSQTAIAMRKEQEEQDRLDQEELDALADEYGDEI